MGRLCPQSKARQKGGGACAPIYGHMYGNRVVTSPVLSISVFLYMHVKGGIMHFKRGVIALNCAFLNISRGKSLRCKF